MVNSTLISVQLLLLCIMLVLKLYISFAVCDLKTKKKRFAIKERDYQKGIKKNSRNRI
jgi:predicted Holliday junction resolvase-like endonuclease